MLKHCQLSFHPDSLTAYFHLKNLYGLVKKQAKAFVSIYTFALNAEVEIAPKDINKQSG